MATVGALRPPAEIAAPDPSQVGRAAGAEADFRQLLERAVGAVEAVRGQAHAEIERFLAGEGGELHAVALAVERAELAFELFLEVRNKVVQAYQEIMRMQI
ncbi:MAG: flagellar hook-basal body complex protein FliE [Bryobacterales bacterium]|nr:flagellar hook-basal body complex protein FliE [Bryobacteraceae bacterium]MDW8354483.1 flagellar hook-basal body complex protein FliE [Bryobacterales bacterium]